MIDIRILREGPDLVRNALSARQLETGVVDRALELDEQRRGIIQQVETLKAERNNVSKEIGRMKDPAEREAKIAAMRSVGDQIGQLDERLRSVDEQLTAQIATIPNIPDARTPYGKDESENVVIKNVGQIPEFDFEPKPHWDLGPALGIINFEQGVKITGSRFYVLSGAGARLQRSLIAFMLDLHARQGYTEKYTPFMVKEEVMFGSGQLPKFFDNLYRDAEEDYWMVPTAEVPLTGLHMGDILEEADLRHQARPPVRQGGDVHLQQARGVRRSPREDARRR
jgi:seryl-tRNA synthetase